MAWLSREWRHGERAGVSGWDPNTEPTYGAMLVLAVAILCVVYFDWTWLVAVCVPVCVAMMAGARYRLTITPAGYRLTRLWLWVIPWHTRFFGRDAIVTTEDDWGVDFALKMYDKNERYEHGIVFGTQHDCIRLSQRIKELAYEVGCRDDRPVETSIAIAVPTPSRRGERKNLRKKANDEAK